MSTRFCCCVALRKAAEAIDCKPTKQRVFDILNPVQCSAAEMDPVRLKQEFAGDIVFWGGGVDTQHTLPFGTPDEVYRQCRKRIEIFGPGVGFVFDAIHNIQGTTPLLSD